MEKIDTYLRWVGCKRLLLKDISNHFPNSFNNYHEPFLGSGIVFFRLIERRKAFLSDLNEPLINCFIQLKHNVTKVVDELRKYNNTKEMFLNERTRIYKDDIKRAAQFIFLNRTSFNGIYRVNQNGVYNVPYGYRKNVDLITSELLYKVHKKLQFADISFNDFGSTLSKINPGDFVYLDPPYATAHQNNGFLEYNQKLFSWDDQIRLFKYVKALSDRNIYFILSNAAHWKIKQLYAELCEPVIVSRYSKIGGFGAKRGKIDEYIFTNIINAKN